MQRLLRGSTWHTEMQGEGTEVSKTRCGRLRRRGLGSSLSVTGAGLSLRKSDPPAVPALPQGPQSGRGGRGGVLADSRGQ